MIEPFVNAATNDGLPEGAWLAALSALEGIGPARLAALLEQWSPERAWRAIASGLEVAPVVGSVVLARQWRHQAEDIDVAALWARYRHAGIGVLSAASPGYPARLRTDQDPPAVLFCAGEPHAAAGRTVAIVGTRKCTRYGSEIAFELGRMLADTGVTVVSGLASGIDAAAHAGALEVSGSTPVAVVGSGIDRPYPHRNRQLWGAVAARGLICGEAPMAAPPQRWRFPARNRIIAAMAEIVIVVESHERGGSLGTAAEAIERDRHVFAVPGPIRSSASTGTNRLLADGCAPLCDLEDVLIALELTASIATPSRTAIEVDESDALILDAIGWHATTLSELVELVPIVVDEVAQRIEDLVLRGVLGRRGPFLERSALAVTAAVPDVDGSA